MHEAQPIVFSHNAERDFVHISQLIRMLLSKFRTCKANMAVQQTIRSKALVNICISNMVVRLLLAFCTTCHHWGRVESVSASVTNCCPCVVVAQSHIMFAVSSQIVHGACSQSRSQATAAEWAQISKVLAIMAMDHVSSVNVPGVPDSWLEPAAAPAAQLQLVLAPQAPHPEQAQQQQAPQSIGWVEMPDISAMLDDDDDDLGQPPAREQSVAASSQGAVGGQLSFFRVQ